MADDRVEALAEAERRFRQMRVKQKIVSQRKLRRYLRGDDDILRGCDDRTFILDALARAYAAGEQRALARLHASGEGER